MTSRCTTAFGLALRALVCALLVLVSACGNNLGNTLENPQQVDLTAKKPQKVGRREGSVLSSGAQGGQQLFPGQDLGTAATANEPPPGVSESDGKYSINIDRADIAEASRLVLGETLGYNYVIDPRVQGTITISSTRPLSSREVLDAFEAALRLDGAALIRTDGLAKVVALQEVIDGETGSADLDSGRTSPGFGVSAVPLRYISPTNMMELMDSFIARSGSVRASKSGNLILVRGSAAERKTLVDVILSFDVDWMQNQTASISILSNSSPEEMVSKLEAVFAEDSSSSGRNGIKVIPLERLNGVVVIANSQQKVRRALTWVRRLDRASITDTDYFVYAVQNGNAADLAKILIATFIEKSDAPGASAEVAPNQPTVQGSTAMQQDQNDQNPSAGQAAPDGKADREDATLAPDTAADTTGSTAQPDLSSGIRITPNPANNTIVIRASQKDYRKILATLRKIDAPSVQVLINTMIVEVALNDTLRYGVQAYLQGDGVSGGIFNGNALKLSPSFPGMNFFLGSTADPRLVVDALNAVTKVRIVSSPSVLVLENETATIKVGDQVPVKTQTINNFSGNNNSVDSFEYRDTGVILKVKPRVSATGIVTIELGQELSSIVGSTTGATNPTISQRAITSKVSVPSSQTVLLGGLISGQDSRQRDSVPGVNRIPILGDLIGKTDNTAKRNELIVFITPRIIQDGEDASQVSDELRNKMKNMTWN